MQRKREYCVLVKLSLPKYRVATCDSLYASNLVEILMYECFSNLRNYNCRGMEIRRLDLKGTDGGLIYYIPGQ